MRRLCNLQKFYEERKKFVERIKILEDKPEDENDIFEKGNRVGFHNEILQKADEEITAAEISDLHFIELKIKRIQAKMDACDPLEMSSLRHEIKSWLYLKDKVLNNTLGPEYEQ